MTIFNLEFEQTSTPIIAAPKPGIAYAAVTFVSVTFPRTNCMVSTTDIKPGTKVIARAIGILENFISAMAFVWWKVLI